MVEIQDSGFVILLDNVEVALYGTGMNLR